MTSVTLRLPGSLLDRVKADLARPHAYAYERVGFVACRLSTGNLDRPLVLAVDYLPVSDEHYIADKHVGAKINSVAIRGAMQFALDTGLGLLHVHSHGGRGVPRFSLTDLRDLPRLVAGFTNLCPQSPHGGLLLSNDECYGAIWLPNETTPTEATRVTIVDYPLHLRVSAGAPSPVNARFARQTFLGQVGQRAIETARFGVVGLGGGGSHIVQQLAHLGGRTFHLFDADSVDETNLNRLVGAVRNDAELRHPKTDVMNRLISGLVPSAEVHTHEVRWQEDPDSLRTCDLVFGCVDSFAQRRELEAVCRRYLIPYVDIGMDLHQVPDSPPRMAGQVILSMPGGPCLFCLGFLNDANLAKEASLYGAAGSRPQVVWANAILASSAIGIAVDLLTGWTTEAKRLVYLSYDGNDGTLTPHIRLEYPSWPDSCPHYTLEAVGDPILQHLS